MEIIADAPGMKQATTQTATVAIRLAVKAVVGAGAKAGAQPRSQTVCMEPRLSRLTLKQPTLYWSIMEKYIELRTFILEVNNMFQTYNTNKTDRVHIIKNWRVRQGSQLLETLM